MQLPNWDDMHQIWTANMNHGISMNERIQMWHKSHCRTPGFCQRSMIYARISMPLKITFICELQSLSLTYSDLQFPNKNDGTIQEAGNIFVLLRRIKFSILFCNETKNVQFLNFSVNAYDPETTTGKKNIRSPLKLPNEVVTMYAQ